jgi:hypothetical protein
MVPPVLAYYGALLTDPDDQRKYLNMAYQQIHAYRQALRDDSGLWKHVVDGPWEDGGHWGECSPPLACSYHSCFNQ